MQMFDLLRDLDVSDDIYDNDDDRDAAIDWQQREADRHYSDDEDYDEDYDEDEDVREGTYEGKSFPPKPDDWNENVVVFHRFNGILSAEKDLDDYPTISHYRNAASHRCTMAESMDLLIEKILKMASIEDNDNILALPHIATPTGAFAPSPFGQVTVVDQSLGRGAPIDNAKEMPYATVKSNTTPGQGVDVHLPDDWFEQRATSCEGIY